VLTLLIKLEEILSEITVLVNDVNEMSVSL